jgi:hypothetical protein
MLLVACGHTAYSVSRSFLSPDLGAYCRVPQLAFAFAALPHGQWPCPCIIDTDRSRNPRHPHGSSLRLATCTNCFGLVLCVDRFCAPRQTVPVFQI